MVSSKLDDYFVAFNLRTGRLSASDIAREQNVTFEPPDPDN
jgi:hypothetical protein